MQKVYLPNRVKRISLYAKRRNRARRARFVAVALFAINTIDWAWLGLYVVPNVAYGGSGIFAAHGLLLCWALCNCGIAWLYTVQSPVRY